MTKKRDRFEGAEPVPPNDTLTAFLRKIEDGNYINGVGAEVQTFFADLKNTARMKGSAVSGDFTLKFKVRIGPDGSALPVAEHPKFKAPKMNRPESYMHIDDDGDVNGKPVERQMPLKGIDGGAAPPVTREPAPTPAVKSI